MDHNVSTKRKGCTACGKLQAVNKRVRGNHAPTHIAQVSKEYLKVHDLATVNWPSYLPGPNSHGYMWWSLKKNPYSL